MIIRILEIGVAVRDVADSGKRLTDILGAKSGKILIAEEYGMKARMFRVGNVEFELMEPLDQKGLIGNFIEKRGEGLHHIAFQVDDIVKSIDELKSRGFKVINEEPVLVDGFKATFLHPDSFGGVLLELIEGTLKWVHDLPAPPVPQSRPPAQGIGAEGILAVGILVEDVERTAENYSTALSAEISETPILDKSRSRICVCQIANVDLVFIEIPQDEARSHLLFSGKRPGLNHVVMEVEDLGRAARFLENTGVHFSSSTASHFKDSGPLFIEPRALKGIPVVLQDKAVYRSGALTDLQV